MKNIFIWSTSIIIFVGVIFWAVANKQSNIQTKTTSLSQAQVKINALAPNATFVKINGTSTKLSSFKGKKTMFWLVATWCSSCLEGARVLAQNKDKLGNLNILVLKTYGNAGYSGPSIEKFAMQSAPKMLDAKNWLWGDLTKQSTRVYNSRNYPDIYFLVDKNGLIRDISDAPAATINSIINFANN